MSKDDTTYKVGNGKPPLHSQWKPGQSGNPAGRKPGSRSYKSIFLRIANAQPKLPPAFAALVPGSEPTNLDQIVAKQFEQAILGDNEVANEIIAQYQAFTPDAEDDESAAADAAEETGSGPCKPDGNG